MRWRSRRVAARPIQWCRGSPESAAWTDRRQFGDVCTLRNAVKQAALPRQPATLPRRTLTVRLPRLPRITKVSLPFTLVQTEPDPAAERAARERRAARFAQQAGRGFARLTVLPVIIVVAWLVPGLPLLLGGVFEPVPELLIAAPLATALAVNLLHRIPGRWPADYQASAGERGWPAAFGIAGTAVIAAGFIAWQLALNSPSVIAARMPGAYFQTGYWIAQHGSLPIPGSLSAFGGPRAGLHVASIGFAEHGHSIVPTVTAGLPMLLSGGFWTSGTGGGAVIAPVLGGLAIVTFGGLVGRLAGRQWAPAGALVLALTLPELYTSRDAFSETAVQVLLFGGISLVIDALTVSSTARVPARAAVAGRPRQSSRLSRRPGSVRPCRLRPSAMRPRARQTQAPQTTIRLSPTVRRRFP